MAEEEKPAEKPETPTAAEGPVVTTTKPHQNKIKKWAHAYWHKKKITIPITVVVLLLLLLVVPWTRYKILGLFIKKNFAVTVEDSKTHSIVSGAKVTLGGKIATSDNKGVATIKAPVGSQKLTITKQYYQAYAGKQMVSLSSGHNKATVDVVAQGRQVPVLIIDKVSGKPVSGAKITVLDTEASTDKDGKATLVIPTTSDTQKASVSANNYNTTGATLSVTDQVVPANTVSLTPAGKLYFLSNANGKIDVVKTDLDGANRATVLPGTGKEDARETVLLASRDWKYLALLSRRDGGDNAKLFLINTSNDKLTTIDEGNASFTLTGWSDHDFVYQVFRNDIHVWQPRRQAIKTYNADSNKLTTLDETAASGSAENSHLTQEIGDVYLFDKQVVYTFDTSASYPLGNTTEEQASLNTINIDSSNRTKVRGFDNVSSVNGASSVAFLSTHLFEPRGIYVSVPPGSDASFYAYENNKLTVNTSLNAQSYANLPEYTYLLSPSGQKTFWGEPRDGKTTLFVGDANAKNQKQIASLSEYKPYGWYTENYVLVQKKDSELYIMGVDGSKAPFKLTDYYKPAVTFEGYGGGYGGL